MKTVNPILGCVAVFVFATTISARANEVMPRYRFEPGQELNFKSTSEFKYGEGENAGAHGSNVEWNVWVLRANPDGSYRLVIKEKSTSVALRGKDKHEQPTQTRIVYADVFPDGRIIPNKTIEFRGHPSSIFPKLPANDAEAKSGWKSERLGDVTISKPIAANGKFMFESTSDSPMNKIYLSSQSSKSEFDPAKGFVTKVDMQNSQGYGFNGKGTGMTELVSIKKSDLAKMANFAAAADKFFAVSTGYIEKTEAAQKAKPDDAKKILAKGLEELKLAEGATTDPELKAELTDSIKQHEQLAKYFVENAERRDKVLGKPAEVFSTKDINGKDVKLSDLKGQVVVLDFWYRGCGWCIKAMPQINQLTEDFAGKPVTILGMNTDRNEEDAKFVIDKMGLKYGTLKAEGLPQKFGVQGFPTLIIIDQKGDVADIHVGYSPTLREEVGKVIKELLAKK